MFRIVNMSRSYFMSRIANMSLRYYICVRIVNMSRLSICPFVLMLALNVGQCRIAEKKLNSRCPHLVGVRDRLPGSLRAGAHPEIRHSIARSLSRDGHVIFTNANLPDGRGTLITKEVLLG